MVCPSKSLLVFNPYQVLLGGYTALSTKGVSSILSFTLWHIITFPVSYLLGFVLVSSALMQIHYINRALQRFDSTQVIPTQFVLFTLSVITGSAVLYRDFESYTAARAGKFVGGCFLTFLGVYFITSGRTRRDDESTFSVDDEEEAIGLLADRQYRESVDVPPHKPERRGQTSESRGDDLQSPSGSLLSHDLDEIVEGHTATRGVPSGAPSSPDGSLTAESLREGSPQPSPPIPPQSLIANPWAESQENLVYTPKSEPQLRRPMTPPGQSSGVAPDSPVLFRFPPAPGIGDHSPQNTGISNTQQGPSDANLAGRRQSLIQTPFRHNIRNSLSMRFSPGPLLPTLSGGFSAVVAESLRRGGSSPGQSERRSNRGLGRRKRLSTSIVDDSLRGREVEVEDYTDASVEPGQRSPLALTSTRHHSTRIPPSAPVTTAQLTSALAAKTNRNTDSGDDITSLNRLRSLSDSWSGGLSWFGGTLRTPWRDTKESSNQESPNDDGAEGERAIEGPSDSQA